MSTPLVPPPTTPTTAATTKWSNCWTSPSPASLLAKTTATQVELDPDAHPFMPGTRTPNTHDNSTSNPSNLKPTPSPTPTERLTARECITCRAAIALDDPLKQCSSCHAQRMAKWTDYHDPIVISHAPSPHAPTTTQPAPTHAAPTTAEPQLRPSPTPKQSTAMPQPARTPSAPQPARSSNRYARISDDDATQAANDCDNSDAYHHSHELIPIPHRMQGARQSCIDCKHAWTCMLSPPQPQARCRKCTLARISDTPNTPTTHDPAKPTVQHQGDRPDGGWFDRRHQTGPKPTPSRIATIPADGSALIITHDAAALATNAPAISQRVTQQAHNRRDRRATPSKRQNTYPRPARRPPATASTLLTYGATAAAATTTATQSRHRQSTSESPCSLPAPENPANPEVKPLKSATATSDTSPPPASDTGTSAGTPTAGSCPSSPCGSRSDTASNHHPSASCPGEMPTLIALAPHPQEERQESETDSTMSTPTTALPPAPQEPSPDHTCTHCNEPHLSQDALLSHQLQCMAVTTTHASPPTHDGDDDGITCRTCRKVLPSRNALFHHIKHHCLGAMVDQRIDQLDQQQQASTLQQTQRTDALRAAQTALFLATATETTDHILAVPDSLRPTPATTSAPTLLQVAPLPTGGGPLGLGITLANPADTHANERITAYYDSGAWSSAVSEEMCTRLGATQTRGNGGKAQTLSFSGFTAGERNATHTTVLHVTVGQEKTLPMRFWVVPDSPVPLLMGRDNMSPTDHEPDDGRACTLDPDITAGSVTFKKSQRTYPAVRWKSQPAATFLTTTTIPAEAEMFVRIKTNTPNATLDMPRAWVTSTLLCAHESTVTSTDADGCAILLITNIDSIPTTIHAGTPLTTVTAPTLLSEVPHACQPEHAHAPHEADPKTDHGVTPLTQTSDEIKKGTTWGNKGQHDVVTQKAYMSQKELRRYLRKEVDDNKLLSPHQRKKLLTLLLDNLAAFSDEITPIGHVTGHDVSFKRLDNKPIWIPSRKMNPIAGAEAIRQVHELEEAGVVHKTTSPNNFPLCMVRKNPGSAPRMCVDLRAYNVRYVGEYFKIPEIRDCLNTISQSQYYSALDATASFHMVPLREDDGPTPSSHQIAFTLPNSERYAYRKLPFGTKDSSFVFSRVLSQILSDFQEEASIYIDDVCLHTASIDGQINILGKILPRLIAAGVRLNPRKSKFVADKVDVLGHTVSAGKIEIQAEKLDAIRKLVQPTSRKELQSLVGVLSWSRRFVADYASTVEPLTRLLRKGQPTQWPECWGDEQEKAFRALQTAMLTHPTLATPAFTRPFEVWTDASDIGIGAVLVQEDKDGNKCAVEFYSKQLSDAEKKYAACEKEALAVLRALTRFRTFLLMANTFTIVVRSDHKGLTSLYKHADESSRLYRWAQQLNEYDYTLKYMSGKSMDAAVPDGLSRARMLLAHAHANIHNHSVEHSFPTNPPNEGDDSDNMHAQTLWMHALPVDEPAPTLTTTTTTSTPRPTTPPDADTHSQTLAQRPNCKKRSYGCKKASGHKGPCTRRPPANPADDATPEPAAAHAAPPTPAPTPAPVAKSKPHKKASVDYHVAPAGTLSCQKADHCTKPDRHPGRCHKKPVHAADDETVDRYDHIVCRAHRNGVAGFRMRWKGHGPDDDSYETLRRVKMEVTHHNAEALVADFVRRERRGDVDVGLLPGTRYPQWENSLSPSAPPPRKIVTERQPPPPFPTAKPKSDRGFATFSGIDEETLLRHQLAEPDTQDYRRYLVDDEYRPTRLPKSTHHAWGLYAKSMHLDEETGLLMRTYKGTTGPHVGQQHHVLVLPETLLQTAFEWAHTLAGHHGAHATMCTIKTRFHCWRLEKRVRACIAACELCTRANNDKRQHPYGSIPVTTFNAAIGFDLIGPFTAVGGKGQEYLVVMIDHATKYLVVHAVNGPSAEDAVDGLTEYILQMGTIPEKIFTDRGSFCGSKKVYTALLARLGIKHHQSMSYSPQGDSHAESGVKNVSRTLRKIIQDYPDRWPEAARWAAYCYNCKYHTTIGTSPFYALHAVEPTQPIDFLLPRPTGQPVPQSITELADRITEINTAISDGVDKMQKGYEKRNDNLRGVRDFKAGDLVWKHRLYPESFEVAGIDTKWFLPFAPEPYIVLERRSDQHSRVRLAYDPTAKYEDVHHQRLRLCSPRDDAIQFELAVPLDHADS